MENTPACWHGFVSHAVKTILFNFSKNGFMRKSFTNYVKGIGLSVLCAGLVSSAANATTFTAVASGNFNAAATWGGVAPGSIISSDIIIIPSGITVTLTGNETFSGTSTLTVNGTLTSASSALVMTAGSLSGTGSITVDSVAMGLASGLSYTGSITARTLNSTGTSISAAANLTVNSTLWLTSGTLNLIAGNLTMASGSTIQVAGGIMSTSGTGTLTLTNPYNVSYTTASTNTGIEISGAGLNNVTVNIPSGNVSLSSDLKLNGTLNLTAGTLTLNGKNLTFSGSGDFAAVGSGSISSTSASNINFMSNNNFTGGLRFTSGNNSVNNLTLNMGDSTKTVMLSSDLNINGQLKLQVGRINVGSNNLAIMAGALVNGGTTKSYVITNNTGRLTMHLLASAMDTFAVGTTSNFAPAIIGANSGSAAGDVSLSVVNSVYLNGASGTMLSTTQPVVNATWYVSSTASSSFSYNMWLMWNAGMEVNSFNRANAYISHYTGGAWDLSTSSAATVTASGMYSMSRSGITSLSPFTVAGSNANMTSVPNVYANSDLTVYPNPVSDVLNINSTTQLQKVDIYDLNGHLTKSVNLSTGVTSINVSDLAAGLYYAYFWGQNQNNRTVQKFVKQ